MSERLFGDLHSLETADGKILDIDNRDVAFRVYGNYGAPPVDFQTRRGYKQNGATEVDFTLAPRAITVVMWRKPSSNRQEYWDRRSELHEFLRPNRGGPLTLTLRQPNGDKRSLVVRASPGMVFPMRAPDDDTWTIEESLEFIAFDPVWFDPDETTLTPSTTADDDLVFPIDFPIIFGTEGSVFNADITYSGTWITYPVMTLTGPYNSAIIENIETGVRITLTVAIGGSEQRIITLTPGSQSIVDQNNLNKFGDLGADSNLVEFNIRPDPLVADGEQTIRATLLNGTGSAFSLTYNTRYFAI